MTCAQPLLWHCRNAAGRGAIFSGLKQNMITLEERIARTERLLRRLEEDLPYLHVRLSELSAEHRQSVNAFADRVRAEAEAELQRLLAERGTPCEWNAPQSAD